MIIKSPITHSVNLPVSFGFCFGSFNKIVQLAFMGPVPLLLNVKIIFKIRKSSRIIFSSNILDSLFFKLVLLKPSSSESNGKMLVNADSRTSLAVQWLRLCLPMQGVQF